MRRALVLLLLTGCASTQESPATQPAGERRVSDADKLAHLVRAHHGFLVDVRKVAFSFVVVVDGEEKSRRRHEDAEDEVPVARREVLHRREERPCDQQRTYNRDCQCRRGAPGRAAEPAHDFGDTPSKAAPEIGQTADVVRARMQQRKTERAADAEKKLERDALEQSIEEEENPELRALKQEALDARTQRDEAEQRIRDADERIEDFKQREKRNLDESDQDAIQGKTQTGIETFR